MLKNKIALKRIRNVIFLGLVIIVMLGIYNNSIRNSRAENTELIDIDFVDAVTEGGLATFRLEDVTSTKNVETVEGVETVTSYSIPLTNIVNGKAVTKYKGPDNTEVEAISGTTLTVPAGNVNIDEINGAGVQVTVTYDQQTVTGGEQTLTVYNQTLGSSPVTVSGYVPDGTTLGVTEVATSSLSGVTLPENENIQAAYDITLSGYQPENFSQTVNVAIYTELTETPNVYHLASDGTTLENMNATLEGKNIVFTAKAFSTYIITTSGTTTDVGDGTTGDDTPDTEDGTSGDTTEEKQATTITNGIEVGDTFESDGATYKITSLDPKTVELVSVNSSFSGDFTVPTEVKPNLTIISNDNIGDYIDLGNNLVGTASDTTNDWRILYVDETNNQVYAVLSDYLLAEKLPTRTGLEIDTTVSGEETVTTKYNVSATDDPNLPSPIITNCFPAIFISSYPISILASG